jgi:RNA polymerase sigma-70 factor (ECF subfamily)
VATTDLIARARAGDGEAFRTLTEPHRGELHVHCYRMLGSVQDAEDVLQDTLVAAWQGLAGFGERASIRTWLYRIATNKCLNALRAARRRPAKAWDIPGIEPPPPTRLGEVPWLGPFPDSLVDAPSDAPVGPEARYEQTESISLAFVAALQTLPPRQLAVLILRDVLGFHADEVADMLDTTPASVNSALARARSGLERRRAQAAREAPPAAGSAAEDALVARFVRAYESADLPALLAMLTDDVFLSMPPLPLEYEGHEAVAEFFRLLLVPGRRYSLVPTRANGQPAFGAYVLAPDRTRRATGLFALTLSGERIRAMTRSSRASSPGSVCHWPCRVGSPPISSASARCLHHRQSTAAERGAPAMGKIVISTNTSLDGVVQDPDGQEGFRLGGWFGRFGGPDLEAWAEMEAEEAEQAEALLLGRRSDEWFASRWIERPGAWAERLNSMPKYVVSATLAEPRWTNATVISGDVMGQIGKIRQAADGDIIVYGSGELVRALLAHGLADELRLTVFPVVLGAGERLFDASGGDLPLRLLGTRTVGTGLIQVTYEIVH